MPTGFGGCGGHGSWGRWKAPWEAHSYHGWGPNPNNWEGWGWGTTSTSWPPWSCAPPEHGSWHHRGRGYGQNFGHHHDVAPYWKHGWNLAAVTAVASGVALGLWQMIARGIWRPTLGISPRREEEADARNKEEGTGDTQGGSSDPSRLRNGQADETQRDSLDRETDNQTHETQRESSDPWRLPHGQTEETQRDLRTTRNRCRNQSENTPRETTYPKTCQEHPEASTTRSRFSLEDLWKACGPNSWVTEVDVWPYTEDEVEVFVMENGHVEVRCSHLHGGTLVSSATKVLPRPPCDTFTLTTTTTGAAPGRLVLTVTSRSKERVKET